MLVDQQARQIAVNPNHSVIARAPAGSGKTGVLLVRYLNCLSSVERPESVLATTFTNKGANEMRERVVEALKEASKGNPIDDADDYGRQVRDAALAVLQRDKLLEWGLIDNPARLRICTFDTFCGSLAKRLPVLSGLGSGSIDESPWRMYREAVIDLLGCIDDDAAPEDLRKAIASIFAASKNRAEDLVPLLSKLLANRDQWMYEMVAPDVDTMESQLLVAVSSIYDGAMTELAGYGFQNLVDLFVQASGFDDKVAWAADLSGVDIQDIESLPLISKMADTLLTASGRIKLKAKMTAREGFPAKKGVTADVNAFLSSWSVNNNIFPLLMTLKGLPVPKYSDEARQLIVHFSVLLRHLLAHLQLSFDRNGKVDFAEVSYRAIEALGCDEEFGDALLEEDRIQHILVDEMQDTSLGQLHLINRLCSHWDQYEGRTIFLCGDPMQSIYLFRGANVNLFTGLLDNLFVANQELKLAVLEANFRSSPVIVDWVNKVFEPVIGDYSCQLAGTVKFEKAVPQLTRSGDVRSVGVNGCLNDESKWIAEDIKTKLDSDDTIVVLGRTRKELGLIANQLKEAGISFSGQDIEGLGDSRDVQILISLIRALWHAEDRGAWFQLFRTPMVGLSWNDCVAIGKMTSIHDAVFVEDSYAVLSDDGKQRFKHLSMCLNAAALKREKGFVSEVLAAWHLLKGPEIVRPESLIDIQSCFDTLMECCKGGKISNIHDFNHKIKSLYAAPKAGKVQVMTIHKSKGLEFDHVYLMGLGRSNNARDLKLFEWRRLFGGLTVVANPKISSGSDNDLKLYKFLGGLNRNELDHELRRLLYVAATRSKQTLTITGTVKVDGNEEHSSAGNSLFNVLWNHIGGVDFVVDGTGNEEEEAAMPFTQRPAPIATDALDMIYFKPKIVESLNESILAEHEAEDYKSLYEKAVGTTYHRLMELEIKSKALSKQSVVGAKASIATLLRRNGCPERDVADGASYVCQLLDNTFACQTGQWIMSSARAEGAEVSYFHKQNGLLRRLVIDLIMETEDAIWVLDYKTATPVDASIDIPSWVDRQVNHYKDKMNSYGDAVKGAGCTKPVRMALYFPGLQCLSEIT